MVKRGYYTGYSYRGFVNGKYMQFASEEEYFEYLWELKYGSDEEDEQ